MSGTPTRKPAPAKSSRPIFIKSTPRKTAPSGRPIAHSAPAFYPLPPKAPLPRPHIAPFDPPPIELPPSPSTEAPSASTDASTAASAAGPNAQPQSYVQRMLSRQINLSTSLPVDVGYLSVWEAKETDFAASDDEAPSEPSASAKSSEPSSNASSTASSPRASTSLLSAALAGSSSSRPVVMPGSFRLPTHTEGETRGRRDSMSAEDKRFSLENLSKSPTIFSLLKSESLGSPADFAFGRRLSVGSSSRARVSTGRSDLGMDTPSPGPTPPSHTRQLGVKGSGGQGSKKPARTNPDDDDGDDLQFAISLDEDSLLEGDEGAFDDDFGFDD